MKKIIKSLCLLPMIFALNACYWDQEIPVADKTVITISKEGESIEINEETYLDVREENGSVKNIAWSSSDTNIVEIVSTQVTTVETEEEQYKVSRATLRANHAGSATITASLKTKVVSCLVVVKDSMEMPVLHLSSTNFSIYEDESFNVTGYVSYHEKNYLVDENGDDFEYCFTPIDQDKSNVVVFEETEGGFDVTGLNIGNTSYTVSTALFGLTCSTNINIKVKDNANFIDIENAIPCEGGFQINLTTINDEENIDNIIPSCKVYSTDGTELKETVSFVSDDSNVVKVVGNKLIAVKPGTTNVKASCNSASVNIVVNVIKPTYHCTLKEDIIDISDAKDTLSHTINLSDATIYGDGISLSIGGSDNVLKEIDDQDIILDYKKMITLPISSLGECKNIILETSKAFYYFNADVFSMVINTVEEVNNWQDEADKYNTLDYASGGYFVLGTNIKMSGVTPVHWDRNNKDIMSGMNAKNGFHGIFDGRGYYIDGYRPTGYGSFITLLASDGIIRNVGFTNITIKGSETGDSKQRTIMLCAGSGTVQNVYLGYKTVRFSSTDPSMERCSLFSGLGPVNAGKGHIVNVFIEAPEYDTTNYSGFFDLMGKDDAASNFYGVGGIHLGRYPLKRDPSDAVSIEYPYQFWGTGEFYGTYKYLNDKDEVETKVTSKETLRTDETKMKSIKEAYGYTYWEYSSGIPQWKTYAGSK